MLPYPWITLLKQPMKSETPKNEFGREEGIYLGRELEFMEQVLETS